jgi:hypothetical protein
MTQDKQMVWGGTHVPEVQEAVCRVVERMQGRNAIKVRHKNKGSESAEDNCSASAAGGCKGEVRNIALAAVCPLSAVI